MRAPLRALLLAGAAAIAPLAAAAQTAIVPDVGGRGLGTLVSQAGNAVTIDGGTLAGANLFHSFDRFSLGGGDIARWVRTTGDPAAVRNVISRVTGGEASQIDGTLDSTALPNAGFWFVNPAGIVFGPGAQLNVPAVAHFATAAELSFADGSRFAVAAPDGSTLSMAAPESFGFVGGQGAISVEGVGEAFTSTSTSLSFTASDVGVSGSRFAARGLDLVAVGDGTVEARLADPLAAAGGGVVDVRGSTLNVAANDIPGGPLRIGGGLVTIGASSLVSDTAGAARGGDLVVQADQLRLTADAFLVTSSRGGGAGGDVVVAAGGIDVDATGGTTTTGFTSVASADGAAGGISLAAGALTLRAGAFVGSTVTGSGDAGDVRIEAGSIVTDTVLLSSATLGVGAGGDIRITGGLMELGNTDVLTSGFGAGAAGDVFVDGDVILMSGGTLGSTPGGAGNSGDLFINAATRLETFGTNFAASSFTANSAGAIVIKSPLVIMERGGIFTSALADGEPGRVLVEAGNLYFDDVTVDGGSGDGQGAQTGLIQIRSSGDLQVFGGAIGSQANGKANGGVIAIEGRDVLLDSAFVQSNTTFLATGDAGSISIKADTLVLHNASVTSSSDTGGRGGDVALDARTITMDLDAKVSSDAEDAGDAGSVSITAGTLDLLDGASITSRAEGGGGNAGSVMVNAGSVTMTTNAAISSGSRSFGDAGEVRLRADSLLLDGEGRSFVGITSETSGFGDAGGVFIDAKSVTVRNGGFISSDTATSSVGRAGNVEVRADELTLANGGSISSDSFGEGDAGNVFVAARRLVVQGGDSGLITFISSDSLGTGNAGTLTVEAGSILVDNAGFISSDTYTLGDAGVVLVKADTITLTNFGNIRSQTNSNGAGGPVQIVATTLTLATGGAISSEATRSSSGNAGGIDITVDSLTVGEGSLVTTSTRGQGNAGGLAIVAKTLIVDGGVISSSAEPRSTGASGVLAIEADSISLRNGGTIATLSANSNRAGQLGILAGTLVVDGDGSVISSENQAGDPTNGAPGPGGDAGLVAIGVDALTLSNGGRISTNSFAGAAGDIFIGFERPGLLILQGAEAPGVIQTSSGAGTGGKIAIAAPLAIVSNGGSILALGEQRGANVAIQSRFFINSSDRLNTVAVDGEFQLDAGLDDVSSGTVSRDLSVLDASKVLQGQCPVARATGQASQLITRPVGPYAREPEFDLLQRRLEGGGGACR